ncbi:MAG: hypothetical protein JJE04_12535 [Acidobacteriia bacterium]|nr:hypothetical protein [Terriglobia bacterium]
MSLDDFLTIVRRWIHLSSAFTLLGGVIYARFVLSPALQQLPEETRRLAGERLAAAFRPWIMTAVFGLLASGLLVLLQKQNPPKGYYIVFAIKMLLALHVFAVAFLLGKPGVQEAKRRRWMTGIVVSGLLIVALSGGLRWMAG